LFDSGDNQLFGDVITGAGWDGENHQKCARNFQPKIIPGVKKL
jgi:hypothetical protein